MIYRPAHEALIKYERALELSGRGFSSDEVVDRITDVFTEILTDRPADHALVAPLAAIATSLQRLANQNKHLAREYERLFQQIEEIRRSVHNPDLREPEPPPILR